MRDENGAISPKSSRGNIEFQPARYNADGELIETARTIISISEIADRSTLIHETTHLFMNEFKRLAKTDLLKGQALEDWHTLLKAYELEDIDFNNMDNNANSRFTVMQEKFATDGERYFYTGEVPNSKLKHVFDAFKSWLRRVYKAIESITYVGADGKEHEYSLKPEVKAVFDHIFGDNDTLTASTNSTEGISIVKENAMSEGIMSDNDSQPKAGFPNVRSSTSSLPSDSERVKSFITPEQIQSFNQRFYHATRHIIKDNKFDLNRVHSGLGANLEGYGIYGAEVRLEAENFRKLAIRDVGIKGNVYIVEGPENDVLLDWDKPMSKQPEAVRIARREILQDLKYWGFDYGVTELKKARTGEDFYRTLKSIFYGVPPSFEYPQAGIDDPAQRASMTLQLHGIPGLRFNDYISDKQRKKTHDFVIWDVDQLEILDLTDDSDDKAKEYFGETKNEQSQKRSDIQSQNQAATRNNPDEGIYNGFRLPFDPDKLRTESGRPIAQADKTEMLLTPDGSRNLGLIPEAIGNNKEYPAGYIQSNAGVIQRSERVHGDDLHAKNYDNVQTALLDVLANYTNIYKGDGNSLILSVQGDAKSSVKSVVELVKNGNGTYRVEDVGIVTNRYLLNKELLYTRSATPVTSSDSGLAIHSGNIQGQRASSINARQSSNFDSLPSDSETVNDEYNQIIGEQGAQELDSSEGWDRRIDNLQFAKKMDKAGRDARIIRAATGWEKAPDGKWRYEIIDGDFNEDIIDEVIDNKESVPLYRIFYNPDLYDAYPQLRTMPVKITDLEENIGGFYSGDRIKINMMLSPEDMRSALIHEIQHAIQDIEGFANGSTLETANNNFDDYYRAGGEVEARNAEKRRNFTDDQRSDFMLADTQDTADWIINNDVESYNQDAWHGSPFNFDRFAISKVNTGEGTQMEAWGLYFGQSRNTGESYRKQLIKRHQAQGKIHMREAVISTPNTDYSYDTSSRQWRSSDGQVIPEAVSKYITKLAEKVATDKFNTSIEEHLDDLRDNLLDDIDFFEGDENSQVAQQALEWLMSNPINDINAVQNLGTLSRSDIPENDRLINYIDELPQQPQIVQDAMKAAQEEFGLAVISPEQYNKRYKHLLQLARKIDDDLVLFVKDAVAPLMFSVNNQGRMESFQEIRQHDKKLASEVEKLMRTAYNGVSMYKSIAIALGSDKQASLWLNKHGVQGVRYNSGSSENDYNFVIFDDKAIKMLEKEVHDSTGRVERQTYNQAVRSDSPELNAQEQLDSVRRQYEGTDQWLKAPNGKKSKLNEKQWLQVRTPNFKRWFGDWENSPDNASKILDENGEPRVFYRGTRKKGIKVFDNKTGTFSTSSYYIAETYAPGGEVYPFFINARNPYVYEGSGSLWNKLGKDKNLSTDDIVKIIFSKGSHDSLLFKNIVDTDGIVWDGELASDVLVTKNPEQIKSAVNNNGNFSPKSKNIYRQGFNPGKFLRDWLQGKDIQEREAFLSSAESTRNADIRFTSNPEIERRYSESTKGVKKVSVPRRIMRAALNLLKSFRGSFSGLSSDKNLLPAKVTLEQLGRKQGLKVHDSMKSFTDNLKGLSSKQLDLFGRKRLLDDLMWRKQQRPDALLPFGFTDQTLRFEHERFTELVELDPAVKKAVQLEERTIQQINNEFTSLAKQLGLNLDKSFSNPHYYRHSVLEYANAANVGNMKAQQSGELQDIVNRELNAIRERSFLKHYRGSDKDINANYIQANAEVRTQMLMDIETMKTLLDIKKKYDIAPQLRSKLKKGNIDGLSEIIVTQNI